MNYVGVKPGSRVLNVFVILKVAALGAVVLLAWTHAGVPGWLTASRVDDTPSGAVAFAAALISILFAYGGWQNANYVAEEMRDPRRHLPRSLIAGTLAVVAIYVLVNIAYLRALGLDGLAATTTPAADAAARWMGIVRRPFHLGRDCHLDVRVPQPRRLGPDARVLRDGRRRRVLPLARKTPSTLSHTRRGDPHAVGMGHRAGRDG